MIPFAVDKDLLDEELTLFLSLLSDFLKITGIYRQK